MDILNQEKISSGPRPNWTYRSFWRKVNRDKAHGIFNWEGVESDRVQKRPSFHKTKSCRGETYIRRMATRVVRSANTPTTFPWERSEAERLKAVFANQEVPRPFRS